MPTRGGAVDPLPAAEELGRPAGDAARAWALVDLQSQIMAGEQDPTAVMNAVVTGALEFARADGAVVELVDGADMVYAAVAGSAAGRLGLRLQASASLSGRCVQEKSALYAADTNTDPRVDLAACRAVGAGSMVVVPLLSREDCLGVLKVYSRRTHAFDDSVVATLPMLASFIANALRHAGDLAASRHAALHDPLTGAANRSLLYDRLSAAMSNRREAEHSLVVTYVDLDQFKGVNDTAGHACGDRLLVETTGRLRGAVRAADTVGRVGGDEFVVVSPGGGSEAQLVERLRQALLSPWPIRATIGTATAQPEDTPATLLARADAALYANKRGPANQPR